MALDKLQLSLVVAGFAGLVAFVGYGKWQEMRARKHAQSVFGGDHRDVLLEDAPATPSNPPNPAAPAPVAFDPDERREPSANAPVVDEPAPPVADAAAPTIPAAPVPARTPAPQWPDNVDLHVDCVLRFEAQDALALSKLWPAVDKAWPQPVAGLRWFGLDAESTWQPLPRERTAAAFGTVVAALQLASRAGAVNEAEWVRVIGGAQAVADSLGLDLTPPEPRIVAAQATELDHFCAAVDVMVGVNVIAHDQPFSGTKIRALAEAAGMVLCDDGVFRALDSSGVERYALANLDAPAFVADSLKSMQSRGITLTLDVPRAQSGKESFEDMVQLARHLSEALRGRLVDDNRAPLADAALSVIREQIGQFQTQMAERGLPAGGALAQRVFS